MSGRPDSFMAIFWGDYARDTGHLDNAEHGAYLMLIKHYWCTGSPLPDIDASLARIACCRNLGAWRRLRPVIERFFQVSNGLWVHKRVEEELKAASERYANRSAGARRANANRWGSRARAEHEPISGRAQADTPDDTRRIAETSLRARASQPQPPKSPSGAAESEPAEPPSPKPNGAHSPLDGPLEFEPANPPAALAAKDPAP